MYHRDVVPPPPPADCRANGPTSPQRARSHMASTALLSGVVAAVVTAVALVAAGVGAESTTERPAAGPPSAPTGMTATVEEQAATVAEAYPVETAPAVEVSPVEAIPVVDAAPAVTDDATSDTAPVTTPEERDRATVQAFLDGFVAAHQRGDVKELFATLHPSIKLAFGEDTCMSYIEDTVGSVTAAQLIDVGRPRPHEMNSPHGPMSFEEVIPFTVDFLTADGAVVTNSANLPLHDDVVHWLTTCGVTLD